MSGIVTIDFHVTSECSQECPYCWGPQGYENPVDTETAQKIIDKIANFGAKRIVFTGGDPMKRADIGPLLLHARSTGLEVALSTTGDELTPEFLETYATRIDLISVPLDGASEEINARTKKAGHFAAVMNALDWLRAYPRIDVKICTPVTRHNLSDIANILQLAEKYAQSTEARVFYNLFQAYPRSMLPRQWDELLVSKAEFTALKALVSAPTLTRVNYLDQETLDRLYVIIFPDGSLMIPSGMDFPSYGNFLEISNLEAVIASSQFDVNKHLRHSRGWERRTRVL